MTHDQNAQFDPEHIKEGTESLVLGPAYFDARAVAERVMAKFDDGHFKSLIDAIVEKIRDKLWDDVRGWLLSDTEINLQGDIVRMVDCSVNGLLGGAGWALQKYALAERYNQGVEIRKAIAKHIPAELQDARIADLEAEIVMLKRDIAIYRNR